MKQIDRDLLAQKIASVGHHVYVVQGAPAPRFAYTVGLMERLGLELVLAGAIIYDISEVGRIVNEIANVLRDDPNVGVIEVRSLGGFRLRRMRPDWVRSVMLGAVEYYREGGVVGYQVVPDDDHWTIDVPVFDEHRDVLGNRAWRWVWEEWSYPVPKPSVVTTNLGALRGEQVTEVARWETDQWEMFAGAGPEVKPEDARVVPLGVLLGKDGSLEAALSLPVGAGLWRDHGGGPWQAWASATRE